MTNKFNARTDESHFRDLTVRHGLDAFDFGGFRMLKAWPPSSIREGEVEFSTVIHFPESPNSTSVFLSSRKIESIYWSWKSFPRMKGVLISLTT